MWVRESMYVVDKSDRIGSLLWIYLNTLVVL